MYSALWHALPGPVWLRIILLVVLATALLVALVLWVFPLIDSLTTPQDVTVEE